jgi:hypothetical protein
MRICLLQTPNPLNAFVAVNVTALDHGMPLRHGPSYDPANGRELAAKKDGNRAVDDQALACRPLKPIGSISRRYLTNAVRQLNGDQLGSDIGA